MPIPHTVLALTARIVAAHLAKTSMPAEALPGLIQGVYRALAATGKVSPEAVIPQPAVPIRRSVFPDHLVCLEDRQRLTMLKQHLRTRYRLTPEQYRAKWGLPASYPMVAPNYAGRRSDLAKKFGLGRKAGTSSGEPVVRKLPARRARGIKG